MPKIIFIYSEFENLGVETLMAIALREGYETELIMYRAENSFVGAKDTHADLLWVAKKACSKSPDLVAFSCVTDNYRHQMGIAKEIKKLLPEVFIIFGGIHVTSVPSRVLSEPAVDAIAVGEAEVPFTQLLQLGFKRGGATSSVPPKGIYFRHNPHPEIWEEGDLADLDTLPFPEKESFYRQIPFSSRDYLIATGRGCPYHCAYCCNGIYRTLRSATKVRRRSPENVIKELLHAKNYHKSRYVSFADDSFTTNPRWLNAFLSKYRAEIGLPFHCNAIPTLLTPAIAAQLREAGCVSVQIGVQSLDEVLCAEVLHRRSNNKAISDAVQILKNENLLVQADHMFGVPGDSPEKQLEAALFYNEVRPQIVSVFWLTYFPATPIVAQSLANGLLTQDDVNLLEQGIPLSSGDFHTGGSMKDPSQFLGIQLLMNWMPFLPKSLVAFLLKWRLNRFFSVKSYYLSTALPRVLRSLFDRRYYVGRGYLYYLFGRLLPALKS